MTCDMIANGLGKPGHTSHKFQLRGGLLSMHRLSLFLGRRESRGPFV